MVFLDLSCINPIRHMSPLWGFRGFGVLVFYTHIAPLGLQKNRSALAIHIALLWSAGIGRIAFYRHIAPLEQKT